MVAHRSVLSIFRRRRFLGSASFEVFKSKFASRVARMALAQGISFDKGKEDSYDCHGGGENLSFWTNIVLEMKADKRLIEGQERGQGAGWRLLRKRWHSAANLMVGVYACTERACF